MTMSRLEEEMTRPPFNRWLAPVSVSVDPDEQCIVIELPFRPEFSHSAGEQVFHGGIIAALADIAGHAAVAVFHGKPTPTITLQIDFIAPAIGAGLTASARLRKLGRSLARADVDMMIGARLVAIARGTFSTMEKSA